MNSIRPHHDKDNNYVFDPAAAFAEIKAHWTEWGNSIGAKRWVIAVSGGKDSTVVCALAAKVWGPENVVAVTIPCGAQADINDSYEVINWCGVKTYEVNIKEAFDSICGWIDGVHGQKLSEVATVNLAPRLRMAVTYAVAQTVDGIVLNTSNLTEDVLGYATLWGDTCGSYAPIHSLTVTEVIALGKWLGIPEHLVKKVPADGLQAQTDEERLGLKYADVDRYIRMTDPLDEERADKIQALYDRNVFKIDMIRLPGPEFKDLPRMFPRYKTGLLCRDCATLKSEE